MPLPRKTDTLLLEVLRLSSPIFTQLIVDKVLVHQNVNMLNVMLAGMLFIGTFQIAATFLRQYLMQHVGQKLGHALTQNRGQPLHVAATLAVDRFQGSERVQMRVLD